MIIDGTFTVTAPIAAVNSGNFITIGYDSITPSSA
jgi:hypothetical protein